MFLNMIVFAHGTKMVTLHRQKEKDKRKLFNEY